MPAKSAPPVDALPIRPAVPPSGWPDQLLFRIGEVADLLGVETHVVRYWQSEFREIRPERSTTGRFLYSRNALARLYRIRQLLYDDRYTIAGAKVVLQTEREVDKRAAGKPTRKPAESSADERKQALLQGQLDRTVRENRGLQARLGALEAELLALRGKVADQLGGAQSEAQRWRGQARDLEQTLAERERALAEREEALAARQQAVVALETAHEQLLAERESALERAAHWQAEVDALQRENEALLLEASEARAALAEATAALADARARGADSDLQRQQAGAWLQVAMTVRQAQRLLQA